MPKSATEILERVLLGSGKAHQERKQQESNKCHDVASLSLCQAERRFKTGHLVLTRWGEQV
jgi:hypothetical protein